MTARSAGAIPADAARRGAVDIADHAGPGVLPDDPPSPVGLWRDRSPRGGARWPDTTATCLYTTDARSAAVGSGTALRFQVGTSCPCTFQPLEDLRPPRPDVGNRQDGTRT